MAACGPNLLGYQHPGIMAAARRQAELGDTMTGPSEIAALGVASDLSAWGMVLANGLPLSAVAGGARGAAFGFSLLQTGPANMPQILFDDDPDMRLGYAWTEAALRYGVSMSPYHNMFMNAAPGDVVTTGALRYRLRLGGDGGSTVTIRMPSHPGVELLAPGTGATAGWDAAMAVTISEF
jgi:hypothetical protein